MAEHNPFQIILTKEASLEVLQICLSLFDTKKLNYA